MTPTAGWTAKTQKALLVVADGELEWYSVRCVFRAAANKPWGPHDLEGGQAAYEERIALWRAESADDVIRLAEVEARTYESQIEAEYLGLAQSYRIADPVEHGGEVFSMIRKSDLAPSDYLDRFFVTGTEYLRSAD